MAASIHQVPARGVLLDIEGTTTPLSFVYDVLFPYARVHALSFLVRNLSSEVVRDDIAGLHKEHAKDVHLGLSPPPLPDLSTEARLDATVAYIHWLMDTDRKSTPLKSIQGKIWEDGYRRGELRGEVFADVPAALERWHRQKKEIFIFSSGSVLAQRLLFAHTTAGDLTRFLRGYFDTNIGAKTDQESYRRIAVEMGRAPAGIVFVSDVAGELDAAASAGMRTRLSVRPGNRPQPETSHELIRCFDELSA